MPNNIEITAFIPLDKLYFDPQNPRLPASLAGIKSDETIIEYLLRDEGLIDLLSSIAQTGYAKAEPLLVVPKDDNGNYIVVEGNRRLAALKLLSNPKLASVRKKAVIDIVSNANHIPTVIPVIKYDERDQIIDYLGYRHITGVKEWDSMAKAKYLKQLYDRYDSVADGNTFKVLAKMIGSNTNYVARLLTALGVYEYSNEKAYFKLPISENDIEFSLITTALSYSNLVHFLGLESADDPSLNGINEKHCRELFDWMFVKNEQRATRLGESRALKELSKIVKFPVALEEFRKGSSMAEAVLYTDEPNETFMNFIIKSKEALKNAKNCLEQVSVLPENAYEYLKDINDLTKTIKGALEARFSESKSNLSNFDIDKLTPGQIKELKKRLEGLDRS